MRLFDATARRSVLLGGRLSVPEKMLREVPEPIAPEVKLELPTAVAMESLSDGSRDERGASLGGSSSPHAGGLLKAKLERDMAITRDPGAAGRALLAQHTVTPTTLDYRSAVTRLTAFHDKASGWSSAEISRRASADPTLQDAALAYLKLRFTPLDPKQVDDTLDASKAQAVALRLVPEMDPTRRRAFGELLFNVAHPAGHEVLWPAVVAAIRPAELEKLLLEKLRGRNELHQHNALLIPAAVYGRRTNYAPSEIGEKALSCAAAALAAPASRNLLLRDAICAFKLP